MKMRKMIGAVLAASMLATLPTASYAIPYCHPKVVPHGKVFGGGGSGAVWGIFGCASSIILAAMQKNALGKGELTPPEAWTCGLLEYYNAATGHLVYVPHKTICTQPERCS